MVQSRDIYNKSSNNRDFNKQFKPLQDFFL